MNPNIGVGKNPEVKPGQEEIQFTPEPAAEEPREPEKKPSEETPTSPGAPVIPKPEAIQAGIPETPAAEEIRPAPLTVESISQETLDNRDGAGMTEAINQVSESPEL